VIPIEESFLDEKSGG